jgi:hypothetical protein
MPLTKIKSLGITDGTIVNADINASAAIDSTKLSGISSDYVLLATTDVTSATASVSFDGYFSSTYKNYKIIVANSYAVNNAVNFRFRLRRSNADVTTSNYKHTNSGRYTSSGGGDNAVNQQWNADYINPSYSWDLSNTATNTLSCDIILYNPLGTTAHKQGNFISSFIADSGTYMIHQAGAFFLTDATTALSGITFYFSSGNIASGNFKLYGIK